MLLVHHTGAPLAISMIIGQRSRGLFAGHLYSLALCPLVFLFFSLSPFIFFRFDHRSTQTATVLLASFTAFLFIFDCDICLLIAFTNTSTHLPKKLNKRKEKLCFRRKNLLPFIKMCKTACTLVLFATTKIHSG